MPRKGRPDRNGRPHNWSGLGEDDDVVWIKLGLQKSDIGSTMSAEKLREMDYSQGFRRFDKQILSIIAQYLHANYDDWIGKPNISKIEEAFRRDLNFSGYYGIRPYHMPGRYIRISFRLMENRI